MRVLKCDKIRRAFQNTKEISRVFSNARSVLSQFNTRLRLASSFAL